MLYQSLLIKYAEIGTKGKNRFLFEDALMKQIRCALKPVDGTFEVTKEAGRIYVQADGEYDYEDTVEALKRVFGIAWICPMFQTEEKDFEKLKKQVVEYMGTVYPDRHKTFKVDSRRADKKYPVSSEQMNRDLGEVILEAYPEMRVDVHHPDILLRVEVRNVVNIYSEMIPGPGGMPVGTNGKAMLLLSGGIDSPVAGYMIAKRGVKIDAVYFHAPPYTSERAQPEGGGPGGTGVPLRRSHAAACGEFYGYSAVYLRTVPPRGTDHYHAPLYDADRRGHRERDRKPGPDYRREYRPGGVPDGPVLSGDQRRVHHAGVPAGDRV